MLRAPTPWLSLRTRRFVECQAFYTQLLGPPTRLKPDAWSCFSVGAVTLVLWRDEEAVAPTQTLQLCLRVAALEQAIAELPEGSAVGPVREAAGGREVAFSDPDGNQLFLYEAGEGRLSDLI